MPNVNVLSQVSPYGNPIVRVVIAVPSGEFDWPIEVNHATPDEAPEVVADLIRTTIPHIQSKVADQLPDVDELIPRVLAALTKAQDLATGYRASHANEPLPAIS